MTIWYSRGPQLELYATCQARTRVAIGRDNPLRRAVDRVGKRDVTDLGDGIVASGAATAQIAALADDPRAREAIGALLDGEIGGLRALNVEPGWIKFTARGFPIRALSEANLAGWLAAIEDLAGAIDALPPPEVSLAPRPGRDRTRTRRGSPWILPLVFGTPALLFVGLVAVAFGGTVLLAWGS